MKRFLIAALIVLQLTATAHIALAQSARTNDNWIGTWATALISRP